MARSDVDSKWQHLGGHVGKFCYGCEKRYPACHDTCEKYKQSKEEYEEYKRSVYKSKENELLTYKYMIDKLRKENRGKGKKH